MIFFDTGVECVVGWFILDMYSCIHVFMYSCIHVFMYGRYCLLIEYDVCKNLRTGRLLVGGERGRKWKWKSKIRSS